MEQWHGLNSRLKVARLPGTCVYSHIRVKGRKHKQIKRQGLYCKWYACGSSGMPIWLFLFLIAGLDKYVVEARAEPTAHLRGNYDVKNRLDPVPEVAPGSLGFLLCYDFSLLLSTRSQKCKQSHIGQKLTSDSYNGREILEWSINSDWKELHKELHFNWDHNFSFLRGSRLTDSREPMLHSTGLMLIRLREDKENTPLTRNFYSGTRKVLHYKSKLSNWGQVNMDQQ